MNTAKILSLLDTSELPALDSAARAQRLPLAPLNEKLEQAFSAAKISESNQTLIRALVLLWHDYLDESHSLSQNIHNADGSFIHGIMHRREPDYGNAKYWFQRVGGHPCFPKIAERVTEFLETAQEKDLKRKLMPDGKWDAFAFVDACETALANRDDKIISLLQRIQRIECETLLEYFL